MVMEPPAKPKKKEVSGQKLSQKWVGQSIKRCEDPRLLTGRGTFVDDISLAPTSISAASLKLSTCIFLSD